MIFLPKRALRFFPSRYGRAFALLCLGATGILQSRLFAQQPAATALASNAISANAAFSITGADNGDQPTHIEVGHVLFLNAKTRIVRIYVANPAVLDSYIVSPKQVILTAKAAGVTSVVLWDEKNQAQTYTVSCDPELTALRTSLKNALPNERVSVAAQDGRIVLTGTVSTQASADAAEKLAALFGKDILNSLVVNSATAKQVRLKVRFIEVDRSRLNQFGINIFAPGGTSTIGSGTTSQFPSTASLSSNTGTGSSVGGSTLTVTDALNFLFYSTKTNVGVSIQDLENKQVLQILAEPTITTLSGQNASFLAGGEFPFPVVQGSTGGAPSITIQFRPFGVRLAFTPKVNVDGSIELKVAPEVSALDYTNAVSISGYTIPAIATKHIDTQVVMRSGQSFAISGLLDRRTTDSLARTPGIASIPFIGALFHSKGVNLSTSELIVVVTPTIVDPLNDTSTPSEPEPVRPFLSPTAFDKTLPASLGKQ